MDEQAGREGVQGVSQAWGRSAAAGQRWPMAPGRRYPRPLHSTEVRVRGGLHIGRLLCVGEGVDRGHGGRLQAATAPNPASN